MRTGEVLVVNQNNLRCCWWKGWKKGENKIILEQWSIKFLAELKEYGNV
jgi:hypothetical protein